MAEMNPAAAIMQQNKQAELGRAADRQQSAQNMMAHLLTLMAQGKMSREATEAQMKIAGQRIAADRDINMATLQTHKQMNDDLLAARKAEFAESNKIAQQDAALRKQDAEFRQTMASLMSTRLMTEGLAGLTSGADDVASSSKSLQQMQTEMAASQAKMEATLSAMAGKATFKDLAQDLLKNAKLANDNLKSLIPATAMAGRAGEDMVAKIAQGARADTAEDFIPLLTSSGALGKKNSAAMGEAILLAKQFIELPPDQVDPQAHEKLRSLLVGTNGQPPKLGPQATHLLVTTLREAAHSLRVSGQQNLDNTTKADAVSGVDKMLAESGPVSGPGTIAMDVAGASPFQKQADLADMLANTFAQVDPHGANLMTLTRVKNEVYQGLITNPTPGAVINQEFLRKTIGEVISGGNYDKMVEAAQGMAAAAEKWGGDPNPETYMHMFFKDAKAFRETSGDITNTTKTLDAYQTAGRGLMAGFEERDRKIRLLNQYHDLANQIEIMRPQINQFPPDKAKMMMQPWEKALTDMTKRLADSGLTPASSILPVPFSDMREQVASAQAKAAASSQEEQLAGFLKNEMAKYQRPQLPAGQVNPAARQQAGQVVQHAQQPTSQPAVPNDLANVIGNMPDQAQPQDNPEYAPMSARMLRGAGAAARAVFPVVDSFGGPQ